MSKYRTANEKRESAAILFKEVALRDPDYVIYTDGGHTGDKSVGAYSIVVQDWKCKKIKFAAGFPFIGEVSNSRAEAKAINLALEFIIKSKQDPEKFIIISDSNVSIETCKKWLNKWIELDILHLKANPDIWSQTYALLKDSKFNLNNIMHCHGHAPKDANPGNNMCDKLCTHISKTREAIIKHYN